MEELQQFRAGLQKLIVEYEETSAFYDERTAVMEERVRARERELAQLIALTKEKGGEVSKGSSSCGSGDDSYAGVAHRREDQSRGAADRTRSPSTSRCGSVKESTHERGKSLRR